MINSLLLNTELWSGFFGTIIGALIGGLTAYFIARYQFNINQRQIIQRDQRDKEEKELALLWQIYFDIKKDCENSKLWDRYEDILQKRENIWGTPTAEYTYETIQYIMRDIRNLCILLKAKESEIGSNDFIEIDLLWERVGQLIIFLSNIYKSLTHFTKIVISQSMSYFEEANNHIQQHSRRVKKRQ